MSETEAKTIKKQGYVLASKLKKGDKVTIGVNDEEGYFSRVITITKVNKVVDYHESIQIEFDGSYYYDELPILQLNHYYKVEK